MKQVLLILFSFFSFTALAAKPEARLAYSVTMEDPASHLYHVTFQVEGISNKSVDFKLPVWTPGYYQLVNYSKYLENFKAVDQKGNPLKWTKSGDSKWTVQPGLMKAFTLSYDIKATGYFVIQNILDEHFGFVSPAGVFMYPDGYLFSPVTVELHPYSKWKNLIATGLDPVAGKTNTFFAPNYDILYDSPMLMGEIEQLPSFEVRGVPHHFIGYKLGDFDRVEFMADLKRMVEGSVAIFDDVPYKHYTFISIGPGNGGKEQLNSTAIAFNGSLLNTPAGKNRLYNFITHEYFHHYNVKRIRPIELGPFNYDEKNRTNMLWVSEGITVYYPYLILRKQGLATEQETFEGLRRDIMAYENKPGHLFQSATQSSYQTWEYDPFGAPNDSTSKTISYYNKGAIIGAMIDFKIRHETGNKKSLDDVMRILYQKYYKKMQRGFREKDFWDECELVAATPLKELNDYSSTVKEIDYPKYFGYAGLAIDTMYNEMPGSWLGTTVRAYGDTLKIGEVTWESPAWKAGIRSGMIVSAVNGEKTTADSFNKIPNENSPGVVITIIVIYKGEKKEIPVTLTKKLERSFQISRLPSPDPLQTAILKDLFK